MDIQWCICLLLVFEWFPFDLADLQRSRVRLPLSPQLVRKATHHFYPETCWHQSPQLASALGKRWPWWWSKCLMMEVTNNDYEILRIRTRFAEWSPNHSSNEHGIRARNSMLLLFHGFRGNTSMHPNMVKPTLRLTRKHLLTQHGFVCYDLSVRLSKDKFDHSSDIYSFVVLCLKRLWKYQGFESLLDFNRIV